MNVNDKQLWLGVDGGLCNRLRVILAGIGWTKLHGYDLYVLWERRMKSMPPTDPAKATPREDRLLPNNAFECDLDELYCSPAIPVTKFNWDRAKAASIKQPPDVSLGPRLKYSSIYTWNIKPLSLEDCLAEVKLLPELQARVGTFIAGCKPGLGAIVRTQRVPVKFTSVCDYEWFAKQFREHRDGPIYLVCDSPAWHKRFRDEFGSRIVYEALPQCYESKYDIQKSAVDLAIMGHCDTLIGTNNTSMLDMAKLYQNLYEKAAYA